MAWEQEDSNCRWSLEPEGMDWLQLSYQKWTKYGMNIFEKDHRLSFPLQSVEAAVENMDMRYSAWSWFPF